MFASSPQHLHLPVSNIVGHVSLQWRAFKQGWNTPSYLHQNEEWLGEDLGSPVVVVTDWNGSGSVEGLGSFAVRRVWLMNICECLLHTVDSTG